MSIDTLSHVEEGNKILSDFCCVLPRIRLVYDALSLLMSKKKKIKDEKKKQTQLRHPGVERSCMLARNDLAKAMQTQRKDTEFKHRRSVSQTFSMR